MAETPRDNASTPDREPRRDFFSAAMAVIVGGLAGIPSLLAGLFVFLDPLLRSNKKPVLHRDSGGDDDLEGYVRVGSLAGVPADGIPRRFPVIDDKIDAWNFSPDEPIGAVYLVRQPSPAEDGQALSVFHSTCPHAGCSVSYRHSADASQAAFHCPCHNSAFNIDGSKRNLPGAENPSPRDLDSLKVKVDDNGDIWIRYVDYYTGIHEQREKL